MPPKSDDDNKRTVGCTLSKFVICTSHLDKIREAVHSTHKATILVTELLNMYIRYHLENDSMFDLSHVFNGTWVLNAYNEVTTGTENVKIIPELRYVRDTYMPSFTPPSRLGIQQCLLYDARNVAAVAWMHFGKRVHSHVRRVYAMEKTEYDTLSKDEKRERKLNLLQVASDLCSLPSEPLQSKPQYHSSSQS